MIILLFQNKILFARLSSIIFYPKPLYTSAFISPRIMSARKGGSRRKSRHKLMKSSRSRGKLSLTRYLQEFTDGDDVLLIAESSVHEGLYHPRFHGKQGEVVGKQGSCYYIKITDGGKEKTLLVHPVHLSRVELHGKATIA